MNESKHNLQDLGEKIFKYIDTRIEHTKLNLTFTAIGLSSNILTGLILLMIFFMFYICFICGISLWIGSILKNYALGFFTMTILHLVLFILILFFKVSLIENPFKEKLTRIIFKSSK